MARTAELSHGRVGRIRSDLAWPGAHPKAREHPEVGGRRASRTCAKARRGCLSWVCRVVPIMTSKQNRCAGMRGVLGDRMRGRGDAKARIGDNPIGGDDGGMGGRVRVRIIKTLFMAASPR